MASQQRSSRLVRLSQQLLNARNATEIVEYTSQIIRWDLISDLLAYDNPKLTSILHRYVTHIDFIGVPIVDRYAPIIDTQYGFPTLLTKEQEVHLLPLLEQFKALEEYRAVVTLDNFSESDQRKLLRDPRARYLAINTRSFMVPDWLIAPTRMDESRQYNGLIDGLRRRRKIWGSDFGLMLPRFYYYNGILHLDGPIFRYWNQTPDYTTQDFLDYHTIVIKQLPRASSPSGDQIQLRYLRDARERTPATTLVFLQDTESPYGFGTLIEFAGSITGTNSQKELAKATTSITLTTVQSRRASGATGDLESQINFPNIRYSNWIPGTREVIHHTVGAPNDPDERDNLLTQAQSLLDDVIAQRTDSTGAIRRLPNIHVYEMPILSTDLSLAHQLFPNVTQFYIFTPEGELELVKIADSRR